MAQPASNRTKGSEELLKRLGKGGDTLDETQIRELVRVADTEGIRILDWNIYGQPGIDRLRTSLQVEPRQLTALVDSVLKLDKLRVNWKIFPKGIPVIDHFQVDIENAGFERF